MRDKGSVHTMPDSETELCKTCVGEGAVHIGNPSPGKMFAPEQDCSAPLLKVENIVSDRFLKRFRPCLNTSVGAEIAVESLIGKW